MKKKLKKSNKTKGTIMKLSNYTLKDIDEGIRDIIVTLNEKNYLTSVCCEGHPEREQRWNAYLGFKHNYDFSIQIPQVFENAEFSPNSHFYKKHGCFYWEGRKHGKVKGVEEAKAERLLFLDELRKWANELEPRELVEEYLYIVEAKRKKDGSTKVLYSEPKDMSDDDFKELKEKKSRWYEDFNKRNIHIETY